MRKELLSSICALSLLCGAQAAFAGAYGEPAEMEETPAAPPAPPAAVVVEEEEEVNLGPYIGFGGIYAFEFFDGGMNVDDSAGFHVRAGYRFHDHVAVEVSYEQHLGFETDPGPGHFEGWGIFGNVKGFFLTGRWQPYALLGMGYLDMKYPGVNRAGDATPGDDFAMRFGLGMDAHLTELISIGPEIAYVLPLGEVDDLDMLTIGLGLQFNF